MIESFTLLRRLVGREKVLYRDVVLVTELCVFVSVLSQEQLDPCSARGVNELIKSPTSIHI